MNYCSFTPTNFNKPETLTFKPTYALCNGGSDSNKPRDSNPTISCASSL